MVPAGPSAEVGWETRVSLDSEAVTVMGSRLFNFCRKKYCKLSIGTHFSLNIELNLGEKIMLVLKGLKRGGVLF